MSNLISMKEYVINIPKLSKIFEENQKQYELISDILNKYLAITKEMIKIDSIDYVKQHQIYDYKFLLENTLLQEGVIVKKRVSKIEKILNSK